MVTEVVFDFILGKNCRAIKRRFAVEVDYVDLGLGREDQSHDIRVTAPRRRVQGGYAVGFVPGIHLGSGHYILKDNFLAT